MDADVNLEGMVLELAGLLEQRKWTLGTAESCTGGLLSHQLTNVSGSSAWFRGTVVAYADEIKTGLLGVDAEILENHGAVSEECVLEMVRGARKALGVDAAVAISGIAGPTGGTEEKPVGTVWMAVAGPEREATSLRNFEGSREEVKHLSAQAALAGLIELAGAD